jgi:ElaB/YqjD/DUF883 family membrane-anchored ribosome-binding protein
LGERRDKLQATERKLLTDTCSYVQTHPMASLGMAVLAGFLLSRIIRS